MNETVVGVVGCGAISGIYLKNLTGLFENTRVKAVCDLDEKRVHEAADKFNIEKTYTLEEMLADSEIEIIVNLTTPKSHYGICKKALEAGKHTYVEKPLCVELEQGFELVEIAKNKGLMLASAPDTFLGAGIQTCIDLIKKGEIGTPSSAEGFMLSHGVESWHPNPWFYYQEGGGPMFDMGPYYLTAMVNMLGPVARLAGMTNKALEERTITNKWESGKKIKVEVPTHISGIMEFANGAVGTVIMSFDALGSNLPRIEVHGTKGSIMVPDPNTFDGPVKIKKQDDKEWREVPIGLPYSENSRGIGVSDMAYVLANGGRHRAHGDISLHVLELMHGFHISSGNRVFYEMKTRFGR